MEVLDHSDSNPGNLTHNGTPVQPAALAMVWWFVLPSPLTPMPLGIGFHMAMRTIVTGPAWRPYGLVYFSNPPRIRLLARFYNSGPHRE